jgi:hypothetical protein
LSIIDCSITDLSNTDFSFTDFSNMGGLGGSFRGCMIAVALAAALAPRALSAAKPTVDELKARVSSASAGERPRLCVEIAQRQLVETDKDYAAVEDDKGQVVLTDVVTYSEMARDYAIQSHKHEKQTEIAVRGMIRKLTDIMHALPHDEQAPLRDSISHLQRVRDDLLSAMFPKGAK